MSTADFFIGQIAEENEFDPMLFDPMLFDPMLFDPNHHRSLLRSSQQYLYDYVGSDQTLPYPLSQLPVADKHDERPFKNQLESTHANFYSSNTDHQHPPTALDQVYDNVSSSLHLGSQTPSWNELSPKRIPKDVKNSSTKSKKKSATKKQKPPSEKPVKDAPKTKRQSKRDAAKADGNQSKESKETKVKDGCEGSLERNRMAASKCRKRKKQWTENLEEKKSGLEAVHSDLQTAYMNLLQESSQLKQLVISHARCQDANIEVWIKNEASKYVHNLHGPQEQKILCSMPSPDGNGSIVHHSESTKSATGFQGLPGCESQDLNSNDLSGENRFEEGLTCALFNASEDDCAVSPQTQTLTTQRPSIRLSASS